MQGNLEICIGHLKIVDHLILGIADLRLKKKETSLRHSSLEIIAMSSWDQICDGLRQGDINAAFIPAPLAMNLFSAGLDIKALMFTHRSGSMIVKNKTADIKAIADFKGKTVLVPSELCIQNMLLHRLLSSTGLAFGPHNDAAADVTREIVHPFLMTEMLMNDYDHDIAGFAVSEPFGSEAIQKGYAEKLCDSQNLWKDHPCSIFVLTASFMGHHLEAVNEIISLFVQTGQYIENKKEYVFSHLTPHFFDPDKEAASTAFIKPDVCFDPLLLSLDIDALNMIQNYMTDSMGVLKNKINLNQFVDNSFILNAISEKKD